MPWFLGGESVSYMQFPHFLMPWVIGPLVLWDIVWKGIALFRAAKNDQKGWFIALLILHTAGILPIIYLLFFADTTEKKGTHISSSKKNTHKKK